jgi:hypothetical protein
MDSASRSHDDEGAALADRDRRFTAGRHSCEHDRDARSYRTAPGVIRQSPIAGLLDQSAGGHLLHLRMTPRIRRGQLRDTSKRPSVLWTTDT